MSKSVHQADFGPLCPTLDDIPDEDDHSKQYSVQEVFNMHPKLLHSLPLRAQKQAGLQMTKPSFTYLSPKSFVSRDLNEDLDIKKDVNYAQRATLTSTFPPSSTTKLPTVSQLQKIPNFDKEIQAGRVLKQDSKLEYKQNQKELLDTTTTPGVKLITAGLEVRQLPPSGPIPSSVKSPPSLSPSSILDKELDCPLQISRADLSSINKGSRNGSPSPSILRNGKRVSMTNSQASRLAARDEHSDSLNSPISRTPSPKKRVSFHKNLIVIHYSVQQDIQTPN